MFPFGVAPEEGSEPGRSGEGRGPDTMNRLLLHGARHHDRDAAFLRWEQGRKGWNWAETPDWQADRHTIRIALFLRQRLNVAEDERIALWMPLGPEWAVTERAVWSVGVVSVPVWPGWELDRVAAVLADARPTVLFAPGIGAIRELRAIGGLPDSVRVAIGLAEEVSGRDAEPGPSGVDGPRGSREGGDDSGLEPVLSYGEVLEYGGVLDTPERASMWRTLAASFEPAKVAAWEYSETADVPAALEGVTDGLASAGRAVDHAALVEAAERLAHKLPHRKGRVQVLAENQPGLLPRALLYAGWADGLTATAFALSRAAWEHVGELGPDVVVGRPDLLQPVLGELVKADVTSNGRDAGVLARLRLRRTGHRDGSTRGPGPGRSVNGNRPAVLFTSWEAQDMADTRKAGIPDSVRRVDVDDVQRMLAGRHPGA
ncbi:MAG: AMP-binding protein [Gemmatimonadota bacterium]